MAMSRKHYVAVAAAVRRTVDDAMGAGGDFEAANRAAAEDIATRLADVFKADNSAFDRQRFMHACGFPL